MIYPPGADTQTGNEVLVEAARSQNNKMASLLDDIFYAEFSLIKEDVAAVACKILGVTREACRDLMEPIDLDIEIDVVQIAQRIRLVEILTEILAIVEVRSLGRDDLAHLQVEPISMTPLEDPIPGLIDQISEASPGHERRHLINAVANLADLSFSQVDCHLGKPLNFRARPATRVRREKVVIALRQILQGLAADEITLPLEPVEVVEGESPWRE